MCHFGTRLSSVKQLEQLNRQYSMHNIYCCDQCQTIAWHEGFKHIHRQKTDQHTKACTPSKNIHNSILLDQRCLLVPTIAALPFPSDTICAASSAEAALTSAASCSIVASGGGSLALPCPLLWPLPELLLSLLPAAEPLPPVAAAVSRVGL